MDNTVTMSLEEYTAIIKENILLKNKIEGLKRNAYRSIDEHIHDGSIRSLSKAEALAWLDKKDNELLDKFSSNYTWTWENIANDCLVMSVEEIKSCVVDRIKSQINCRLNDLIEIEKDSNQ